MQQQSVANQGAGAVQPSTESEIDLSLYAIDPRLADADDTIYENYSPNQGAAQQANISSQQAMPILDSADEASAMPVQSFNMNNPTVSQFAPQYSQPLTVQQRYQQAIAGRQQQPYVAPAPRIYGHQRQTQIPILDSASQMGNPMMQGYANNYMPPAPLPVAAPQQYNPGFGGYDQNARFSGSVMAPVFRGGYR